MSLPFLETIGLTKNEATLYELLLRLGETPVGEIIKESKLKRATAYKSLYSLQKKGLVQQQDFRKKLHFRPEPPAKLLALAEQQHEAFDRAKTALESFVPQMTSSYILAVEKPVVSTYEGIKGLKEIYEDTLRVGKPIYAVFQHYAVEEQMEEWLRTDYVKRRIKKGIPAFVISATGGEIRQFTRRDKKELRETVTVPVYKFPFQHEVNIYGDKVAYLNYRKGEPLIGIVIHHPLIAQTMKSWFDLAWEGAKQYIKSPQPPSDLHT